jgi:hypothetical protein
MQTDVRLPFEVVFLAGDPGCWAIYDRKKFTHLICESEAHARKNADFYNSLGYRPDPEDDDDDE